MNRLLVTLLAAFDAVIAAAVGVAAALAPLTVLWALGFGGTADWGALWSTSVRLWQFGHLVPVQVTLPQAYTVDTGIGSDAVGFTLSLAPLAFACFTALFAARSGVRAAGAGAWPTGWASGTVVFTVIAVVLQATASSPLATVESWQAVLLPAVVYAVPALLGAIVRAWRDGDDGLVDSVFVRLDRTAWAATLSAAARATAIAVVGFVGVGAFLFGLALLLRAGDVVALYQAANVDALGATVFTLGQLAYLPTFVVWAGSVAAGPGFTLGAGSTVAASGTQLGVVPGIPVLGAVPPESTSAVLLFGLLFVAVGFIAGLAARARLRAAAATDAVEPVSPRLYALGGTMLLSAAVVALLAVVASGAFGPDRLTEIGPAAGPLALAYAGEIGVGAAIALFGPASLRRRSDALPDPSSRASDSGGPSSHDSTGGAGDDAGSADTEQVDRSR